MCNTDQPTDVLLFPRAYYYEGYDPWAYPVNRGRLAEALLLFRRVRIVTDGFTEVIALVEELGANALFRLIESGRLQFVLYPYFFAKISEQSMGWDVGSVVLRHFGDVMDGKATLGEAIQYSLNQAPYDVPALGPELLAALEKTTVIASPEIPGVARTDLARDLSDDSRVVQYECLLENHLGWACPIHAVFGVDGEKDGISLRMRATGHSAPDEAEVEQATRGLLMLLEVGQQLALSAAVGTRFISSNPFFEQIIAVKSKREDIASMSVATSLTGLRAAMRVLQLPDLCFLVNSDLVPFDKAVTFAVSKQGERIREFLATAEGQREDEDLEKAFLATFAENLLPKGRLEELMTNRTIGTIAFAVGQALSFASPFSGIAFALVEEGARVAAQRRWKPLPVIKKHLVGNVLARDVKREQDKKRHYPSLSKLASQGYEVIIVREFPEWEEFLGEVVLAAQKGKMHWHIVVSRGTSGEQYLAEAKEKLPSADTPSGRLLRKLAVGRLQKVVLSFLEGGQQELAFSIQTARASELITGPYKEFARLLEACPHLLNPDKANEVLHTRGL